MANSNNCANLSNIPHSKLEILLHYAQNCDKILLDGILKDFENTMNKKILEQHKYNIYFSEAEQAWRTYLPDESKKNHRRPIKRKEKADLEKEIVKFYLEKAKESDMRSKTLQDLYEEWLIFRRDNTSAKSKTIQENVCEWNLFFKDTDLAKMPITDIKPITLIRFFRKITKDREYTHKRISNARSVLNGIMAYAIELEIITHNPVSDVNFKQFTYKPVEILSDNVFSKEDTIKLLSYLRCIHEPYSLAIQLSFYLFIRVGETKGLRWSDIDYEARTIYLHRQVTTERVLNDDLTFSKRKTVVSDQMKGNTSHGFRKQYLTDNALIILEKAKELSPHSTYIFEPNGQVMTTDSFNRRLKKYCKEAGVPYHSSHKIRFYNASTAYDGKNLVTISKLMGHSQVETTLHYLRNVQKDEHQILAFNDLGLPTA